MIEKDYKDVFYTPSEEDIKKILEVHNNIFLWHQDSKIKEIWRYWHNNINSLVEYVINNGYGDILKNDENW